MEEVPTKMSIFALLTGSMPSAADRKLAQSRQRYCKQKVNRVRARKCSAYNVYLRVPRSCVYNNRQSRFPSLHSRVLQNLQAKRGKVFHTTDMLYLILGFDN